MQGYIFLVFQNPAWLALRDSNQQYASRDSASQSESSKNHRREFSNIIAVYARQLGTFIRGMFEVMLINGAGNRQDTLMAA